MKSKTYNKIFNHIFKWSHENSHYNNLNHFFEVIEVDNVHHWDKYAKDWAKELSVKPKQVWAVLTNMQACLEDWNK